MVAPLLQQRQPPLAFRHTSFDIDRRIKLPRLFPQQLGLLIFPGIEFENGQAANGVGQIQWWRQLVLAIDFERGVVAGLSQIQPSYVQVNVSHMPDRVGHPETIALRLVYDQCFLVVLESGIAVMKVALDLPERCDCLRQIQWYAGLAAESDRLDQL